MNARTPPSDAVPSGKPLPADQATADKFAESWNNVWDASVYTREQFEEWIAPWDAAAVRGRRVLELGCGSGALLVHMSELGPGELVGVDLGSSVERARAMVGPAGAKVHRADLTDHAALTSAHGTFDLVYSIGVIHHLTEPERGVESLLRMTRPGGRFHGWVYAHEGNAVVRWLVEPTRRLACRLPWRVAKYGIAFPLAIPFFLWSKSCRAAAAVGLRLPLPLWDYMLWIGKRGFRFHHHVAFDQIVTPMTTYIRRERVERWLSDPRVVPSSAYVVHRNGNGWKFGGTIRAGGVPTGAAVSA